MTANIPLFIVIIFFSIMNLLGFTLMAVDKQRARKGAWRIPERSLLTVAFLGGGIGSLLGMYTFRHKTKHVKFILLEPVAAMITILLIYLCFTYVIS